MDKKYFETLNYLLRNKVAVDKSVVAADDEQHDDTKYGKTLRNLHYNKYLLDKSRLSDAQQF